MRMGLVQLRLVVESLLRESIMSDLEALVGRDLASRFEAAGSKARSVGGREAVERFRSEAGPDAPKGHDAGWWVSRITKARKGGDASGEEALVSSLDRYLSDLESTGSKRQERRIVLDTEAITERFTAPDGTPFEVMVPLTHAGAVRCSARVGGSTWCTASRESPQSFVDETTNSVLFILSPHPELVSPSGKPEAVQVALSQRSLIRNSAVVSQVAWASQSRPEPYARELSEAYGEWKVILLEIYRKHRDRIDRALGFEQRNDPREEAFPTGQHERGGSRYLVSGVGPEGVGMSDVGRLGNMEFEDLHFRNAAFPRGVYSRVEFVGCDFRNATFPSGTVFRDVEFTSCRLDRARFDDCSLLNVNFDDCSLDGTDFTTSDADGVHFQESNEPLNLKRMSSGHHFRIDSDVSMPGDWD